MVEFSRMWDNKKIRVALILFVVMCFFYVGVGITNYNAYTKESKHFERCEKVIASYHDNYVQYATTGVRILWGWSPLNIFFNTKGIKKTYATINTSEIIEIIDSKRCEYRVNSKSLSDIMNIAGSLLYLYLGFTVIHNSDYIKFLRKRRRVFGTISGRAGFLVLLVGIVFLVSFLMVRLSGIVFSWTEVELYLDYAVYTTLFLLVFYGLGVISAFLLWNKKLAALALIILFITPGLLPELLQRKRTKSVEMLNIQKVSTLAKFEKEAKKFFDENPKMTYEEKKKNFEKFVNKYMNEGFRENEAREKKILEELEKNMKKEERLFIFFPGLFMNYLSDELSANSIADYVGYFNEILRIRFKFYTYINEKRLKEEKTVKPLKLEYLYQQKPILPETYRTSIVILLGYLLLMTVLVYWFLGKNSEKDGEKIELPEWAGQIQSKRLNFKKFGEGETCRIVYEAFMKGDDVSGLDDNQHFLFQYLHLPVKMACLALSRIQKVDKEKLGHLLNLFELSMDTLLTEKNVPSFYVAYGLAVESQLLVINDFLGNMSYRFYERFEEALKYALEGGKTVLFLSCKNFKLREEEKYFNTAEIQTLNLKYHSMR